MISTFIIENYLLVRVAVGVGAAGGIALAAFLTKAGHRGQRIAALLAIVATLIAIGLTLTPDKFANTTATCNVEPFLFFNDMFNIVLFFLPALFAVIATRRPLIVLASGIGLSMVIEAIQAVTLFLGRRCDINDWLANSTGTLIGVLAAAIVLAIIHRARNGRQRGQSDATEPPPPH